MFNHKINKRFPLRLAIAPIKQTGHNGKTTAIASIEQYFSEKMGYVTLPLHKSDTDSLTISLRQIAKKFGSIQGELLEIKQMEDILHFIGYESQSKKCESAIDLKEVIVTNLKAGLPLITFFAVNRTDNPGAPIDHYDGSNEQAAVIVDYEEKKDTVTLMHWGTKYTCPLSTLFTSMMCLPEQRNKEVYYSIKKDNKVKKYDLMVDSTKEIKHIKESITPTMASGFRGKLIVLEKAPELKIIRDNRKKLILDNLNFEYLISRIHNDSCKGIETQKAGHWYQETIHHSIQMYRHNNDWQELRESLNKAGKTFYSSVYTDEACQVINTTTRNNTKRRLENFNKHIFNQVVCLSMEEKQEVNKKTLRFIDYYESCVIKAIGIFNEQYGKRHDHLEFLRKVIIPAAFHECYDSQLIAIKEALAAFITLFEDETRSVENRKTLIKDFYYQFEEDITSINISIELTHFVENVYRKDLKKVVTEENIDKIHQMIDSEWLDDERRSYLLCEACEQGKEQSVKALLQIPGVDVNYINQFGFTWGITPFMIAVQNNHINIVKILKRVAELNPNILRNSDQYSPLYWAANNDNIEMVKELLEIKVINIDHISNGNTALSAAARNNNLEMVKLLLEAGADPRKGHIPYSTKQDINSLLQQSMQQCLHKSMRKLGYIGSKEGVCLAFAAINIQKVLCGEKVFDHFLQLLFKLRQLRLHEYQLCLWSEDTIPDAETLYVKKVDQSIEYMVISPRGDIIKDTFDMKIEDPLIETLQPRLSEMLEITSSRGHTAISDLKLMQMEHDKLIQQAEEEALQEMEYKSVNDLSESQKETFRKLTLRKTKTLYDSLPSNKKEQEKFLLELHTVFNAIDIIMSPTEYSELFPLKNMRPNDTQVFHHGFKLIKPLFLEKSHNEFLINDFDGLYKAEELILYFKELRSLFKEEPSITEPMALLLKNYNHAIAVIYCPKRDVWRFINVNKFPRKDNEIEDFITNDDTVIAKSVRDGFWSKDALFSTMVYSVTEKMYSQDWSYFAAGWDNNKEEVNKKAKLISMINRWMEKLKTCHAVTLEKATMKLDEDTNYLSLAAREGNVQKIQDLLHQGANVNLMAAFRTPLFNMIAHNQDIQAIQALFSSKQKVDVNLGSSKTGDSPLHEAVWAGRSDVVKFLFDAKNVIDEINPNLTTNEGVTPLYIAIQKNNVEMVQLLLSIKKVDPNIVFQKNGLTPLHKAIQNGNLTIIKLLLEHEEIEPNKENIQGATPLYLAAQEGDVDIVKLFLDSKKVDVNKTYKSYTPLQRAILSKKLAMVELMLQYDTVDLGAASNEGITSLYAAAEVGYTEVAKFLLESGKVDPNATVNSVTPFLQAIFMGNIETAKLFLKYPQVELDKANNQGATPLYIAVQNGHTELVKLLLASGKADPNKALIENGITPLHIAVLKNQLEIIPLLLATGQVSPNQLFSDGDTLLHYALKHDLNDVVHILIDDEKIDLNIFNKNEVTPLMRAIHYKDKDIINKILATGKADVNLFSPTRHFTSLHYAAGSQQSDVISALLKHNANPNVCNDSGFTPLYCVAEENNMDSVIEFLKFESINIDLFQGDARAPLFVAAMKGHTDIVTALLKHKADPNLMRAWDGATPLYMAAQHGHYDVVKALLESNANPHLTLLMEGNIVKEYSDGEYPPSSLEIAVKNGHTAIVKLLLSYKAEPFKKAGYPACVSNALEKCCRYEAKTNEELKQHYAKFIEIDTTIHKLLHQAKKLYSNDEKTLQTYQDRLFIHYDNYIHDMDLNEIVSQLKLIERDLEPKVLRDQYQIKTHVNVGHLLFSTSSADRLKELIKMAWDTFMEDYDYQDSPINKVVKKAIKSDFNASNLEKLLHAIGCEIHFLTFSKSSNRNNIMEDLENLKRMVNSLHTVSQKTLVPSALNGINNTF